MSNPDQPARDFLVLSRGQWDPAATPTDIEAAIAKFYSWYEANVKSGQFKPGSRLSTEIARVSKTGIVTDSPMAETTEVIGGYWIICAGSLHAAAEIAAENPCIRYGLAFEIRPLESARASVYTRTNESSGKP